VQADRSGDALLAGRRLLGRMALGGAFLLLVLWAVAAIAPVAAALLSSLKNNTQLITQPLAWPDPILWDNYQRAWSGPPLGQPFHVFARNSVLATTVGLLVGLSTGTLAAYAVARHATPLFEVVNRYFVLLITVPPVVAWIPLFSLADALGMLSNPVALGVIYGALVAPVAAVLMRAYFSSFPLDLIEAARADGAGELVTFLRIVLPLSRGALIAVGLVQGIFLWNELGLAAVLLLDPASRTLPIGMTLFQGQAVVDRGAQFASLVMMVAPIVLLYFVFSRQITTGLRVGGLK
jgi:ABC-type glycerol-3-phosphate transport system permease component